MPFPYVEKHELEAQMGQSALDFGMTDGEWSTVLARILKAESERVEGPEYADQQWRNADEADVPFVVENAVVTLARHAVSQIEEHGLEQESAEDRSEHYTPTETVRETVKEGLADAGYGNYRSASLDVPTVR